MKKLSDKSDKSKQIATNIAKWDKERIASEYFCEKLSEIDPETKLTHLDSIADNMILKAKLEDDPRWTPLVLSMIKTDTKKPEGGNTINFFALASEQINESVGRLINVTPKKVKRGIESII